MTKRMLKRGWEVTVLAFGDEKLRRRVWKDVGKVVFLSTEEEYQRALKQNDEARAVGFPKDDVIEIHDTQRAEDI